MDGDTPTVDKFIHSVRLQVDQFRREFSLTYVEAIGALEMIKHDLLREAEQFGAEDDDAQAGDQE